MKRSLLKLVKRHIGRDHIEEWCHRCGHQVACIWTADGLDWHFVVQGRWTILCPRCFDELAGEVGHHVRWVPKLERAASC